MSTQADIHEADDHDAPEPAACRCSLEAGLCPHVGAGTCIWLMSDLAAAAATEETGG